MTGAVHFERFDCVAGAARCESAWGGAAGKAALIPAHCRQQPLRRRAQRAGPGLAAVVEWMRVISRSRSTWISANDRSAAAGVAPMSNKPAGRSCDLAAIKARRRRRSRLRVTAGPTARPIAYATWGDAARGSGTKVHHRTPARARDPVRDKRSNADRPRTRPIKRTDGGGPWPGEPSTRRVHHEWPCGRGSRASWHAASCWVERCASNADLLSRQHGAADRRCELARRMTRISPEPCKATGWAPNLATRATTAAIAPDQLHRRRSQHMSTRSP